MKKQPLFNTKPWYIFHIILLVLVAFIGGHFLQDYICSTLNFCIEQFTTPWIMILANLIYYSILAWLVDSIFHSLTGLD